MQKVTLTSKGQLTLPIYIRRHFGLEAGDQLLCTIENGYIRMAVDGKQLEAMPVALEPEPAVGTGDNSARHRAMIVDDEDVTLL